MADSAWIKAMQEEIHQFERLEVWELVDKTLYKNVIKMKWLWKNKHDEENIVIRNKACLVAKGYGQREGIDFEDVGTPMATKPLDADLSRTLIDQTKYRSMVMALMYLIANSDHLGYLDSRKSTSGGIKFLGCDKLVNWSSKNQDYTSMSSAKVEYMSLSACYAQVLWLRTQLTDYGFPLIKIPMYCNSKAAIAISCNPVQHSCTKHINVRYHFIKEHVEKGIVELIFVRTEYRLAYLFTKALPENRFKYLIR
ncbi:retrovirus-related pol polyprotein from transposon TNT 1-94 [Tanacetum coccineum]